MDSHPFWSVAPSGRLGGVSAYLTESEYFASGSTELPSGGAGGAMTVQSADNTYLLSSSPSLPPNFRTILINRGTET